MFNDEEDVAAFENELYGEESSSDESIDSEVEFHLYSQVHYSQNLSESNVEELDKDYTDYDPLEEKTTKKTGLEKVKNSVITISDSDDIRASDSPAVITISDSLDEDGVNCSKARGKVLGKHQQSTPKNIKTEKKSLKEKKSKSPNSSKSYKGGVVQEVLVIRGSSDEEDLEEEEHSASDSDQSCVENWMLLGRAREDGDASIQLNVGGSRHSVNEGNNELEWSIGRKDLEAHVTNFATRRANRYYTGDKNVICRNCNNRGHLSKNCPQPKKLPACCLCGGRGHLQYMCPSRYCLNCWLPGHFYQNCAERPYWQKKCHRCSMIGHYADACPEIWRQYHLTVKPGPIKQSRSASTQKRTVYCCNCGRKGHCGYDCNERRMHSSDHPSCELVFSYDDHHAIQRRYQRAKRKFQELQEAGIVPLENTEQKKDQQKSTKKIRKKHSKAKHETKKANKNVQEEASPELQEAGLVPLEIAEPKADQKKSSKKIRKKQNKAKHEKRKESKNLQDEEERKRKKRKRKRIKLEEEDFPRGNSEQNQSTSAVHHARKKSTHLFYEYRKEKKRNRETADLLIIKQKKKKSRK
ncbi:zinc finger CCHC domain-containing protein 7 [Hyperolius riggenbachi]|uniref:zinc finger CCHC domain-containing protein 7 n=1 Tax=Hyperolius riggenbachi TaxID=752182 RepID=UPI0035A2BA1F